MSLLALSAVVYQTNMRRTLIIAGAVVVLILLLVGAYFLFFIHSNKTLTGTPGSAPFGTSSGTAQTPASPVGAAVASAGTQITQNFVKITDGPVAVGVSLNDILEPVAQSTASSTASTSVPAMKSVAEIRYVDRDSGNIYAYRFTDRTLTRLTNRTLPGIVEASWSLGGGTAFLRFASGANTDEHVETYALPIGNEGGGYILERDLAQAFAVGSSTVDTLRPTTDGSVGTSAKLDGSSPHTILTTPLSSLRIISGGASLFAYTLPSVNLSGYAFRVDGKTGNLTRLAGPLPGLSILPSPSGKLVLVSYATGGTLNLAVIDGTTGAAVALPLATLAEKCAWTSDGSRVYCSVPRQLSTGLPDDWYQGTLSFDDRIWKIDLSSRVATLVLDPGTTSAGTIDAIALTLDQNSSVLSFTNKSTGALYALGL